MEKLILLLCLFVLVSCKDFNGLSKTKVDANARDIMKLEEEQCFEVMRCPDDNKLLNYNEAEYKKWLQILKDEDIHKFTKNLTNHDLTETLGGLQDNILAINDLHDRLTKTADELKLKAQPIINEMGNLSKDMDNNRLRKELDGMISNLNDTYGTLSGAKTSLDSFDENLMKIRAVANKIKREMKRYLDNEEKESQKAKADKAIEMTKWVIREGKNGTAYIIAEFMKIRIWNEMISVLNNVEMKSTDGVIEAITLEDGLKDLKRALNCLIEAGENYLK